MIGDQPMSDSSGNYITYNGEIYNYLEFSDELVSEQFIYASDTEVVPHSHRKWGCRV